MPGSTTGRGGRSRLIPRHRDGVREFALCRSVRRRACVVSAALLLVLPLAAQGPESTRALRYEEVGRLALEQAVRDAGSDNLALVVAAHPDDRWVLPTAYLRFEHGMRVAVLLCTRGKGGQNSRGPQTGDELGRLRTLESERSAARLGAKVHYLNRPDSGFSRSAAETLQEWGAVETAQDLARQIRKIKPDIVLTTHHPAEPHGHDLALLEILPRAVELAADPEFVTAGLAPFVVTRLFRGAAPDEADQATLSLSMDRSDAARGRTYRELAYRALEEHHTQAPLQPMEDLLQPILELVSVKIADQPLHATLLEQLPNLFRSLHENIANFDDRQLGPQHFEGLRAHLIALPALSDAAIRLQRRLRAIPAAAGSDLERRLQRRMAALERIIVRSASVRVFFGDVLPGAEASPGDELPLQIWIANDGRHTVRNVEIDALHGGKLRLVRPGAGRRVLGSEESVVIEALYTPPDFTKQDLDKLFEAETFEEPLQLRFRFTIDDLPISVQKVIPTDLQPAVKVTVTPPTLLIPSGVDRVPFVVAVARNTSKEIDLKLRVNAPFGGRVDHGVQPIHFAANERFREFTFAMNARNMRMGGGTMTVDVSGHFLSVGVHKVDVSVAPDLRVGLIQGVDNTARNILAALLGKDRLEVFERDRTLPILDRRLQTIVVDIRALRSRSVRSGFARLLEFVADGGRLVVFYHKDVEFNPETASFKGAPYPLRIGKGRVTRQDAPVRVLRPEHAIFNHPNKIRSDDWDGWRQERGLYFPTDYDPRHFEELLEMNDPGLEPERGALLYARYGKGEYVYCALALYRQLKYRHAGACRLFANLISPRPRN